MNNKQKNVYTQDIVEHLAIKYSLSISDSKKALQFLLKRCMYYVVQDFNLRFVTFAVFFKRIRQRKKIIHPLNQNVCYSSVQHGVKAVFSDVLKDQIKP